MKKYTSPQPCGSSRLKGTEQLKIIYRNDIRGSHGGEDVEVCFSVVTPCEPVGSCQRFIGTYCSHLQGCGWRQYVTLKYTITTILLVLLWNVGIYLQVHMVFQPRRPTSTSNYPGWSYYELGGKQRGINLSVVASWYECWTEMHFLAMKLLIMQFSPAFCHFLPRPSPNILVS
jgi:hypothetical protein